jgi:hypothetical protein
VRLSHCGIGPPSRQVPQQIWQLRYYQLCNISVVGRAIAEAASGSEVPDRRLILVHLFFRFHSCWSHLREAIIAPRPDPAWYTAFVGGISRCIRTTAPRVARKPVALVLKHSNLQRVRNRPVSSLDVEQRFGCGSARHRLLSSITRAVRLAGSIGIATFAPFAPPAPVP